MTEAPRSGGTPAAAPRDSLESMRAEWERDWGAIFCSAELTEDFIERALEAWQLERNAKVRLRQELAGALSGVAPEPSLADRIAALTDEQCYRFSQEIIYTPGVTEQNVRAALARLLGTEEPQ